MSGLQLRIYKYMDVILMLYACSLLIINLPGLLNKYLDLPYSLSILLLFLLLPIPIFILWFSLFLSIKNTSSTIKTRIKEIHKLEKQYHITSQTIHYLSLLIPQLIITIPPLSLLLILFKNHLLRFIIPLVASLISPLFIPILIKIFIKSECDNEIKNLVKKLFSININYVGLINDLSLNAYAVSTPIYKVLFISKSVKQLPNSHLKCLLAHEAFHLKYFNTYFLFATVLCLLVSEYNLIPVITYKLQLSSCQVVGLIALLTYLVIRVLPILIIRFFERRADAFALNVVGKEQYVNFLNSLKKEVVFDMFDVYHSSLEDRIKRAQKGGPGGI